MNIERHVASNQAKTPLIKGDSVKKFGVCEQSIKDLAQDQVQARVEQNEKKSCMRSVVTSVVQFLSDAFFPKIETVDQLNSRINMLKRPR